MESGRIFFDPSACQGNLLFLGSGNPAYRGPRSMMSMEETTKRPRPFFSSPEDLFDEEYYDDQSPEKKRRLTPEQVHLLEKSFEAENKLEPERKSELAKNLGLQPRQVAVWFQNRRARWKNKQLERDYDLLKASYDSLLSNYDNVVKENQKLNSEIICLNEKLQTKEVTPAAISGTKSNPLLPEDAAANVSATQLNVKLEDRLSSGSTASAVVDEDSPQLVDSGDSYFPDDNYAGCMVPGADGIPSEEDDGGSDDGRSYFSHVLMEAGQEQHEEGETLNWWVWP